MRVEHPITIAGRRFRLILESEDVHGHVYLTANAGEMKAKLEEVSFGDVPVAEGDGVWASPELFRGQCPSCLRMEVFGHSPDCTRVDPIYTSTPPKEDR